MKLISRIKKTLVTTGVLALLMIPATGYSWTHDQDFGCPHGYRTYHSSYYGHGYNGGHNRYYNGGWDRHNHYTSHGRYYASPFSIFLPGFSFYIGP
ncbi:MAG: hypothetical protein AB9866_17125 [Syntrophobacteraceae bacterium]